ncbi:hypothetical protein H0N99_01310 [Candidatus Micrarchaeota archaeon]|nr:hypothetical protein [Candidatus Micrarchaeota archaeon]
MHRVETGKQEGIREDIMDMQQKEMKKFYGELQQNLADRKGNFKGLIVGLGRKLEHKGIDESRFADFLCKEVGSELNLMLKQIKKEWVDALEHAEDLGEVSRARDGVTKKAGIIDLMAKRGRDILAVAYCLNDAHIGKGGVADLFSKMSEVEADITFKRARKDADKHIEKLVKDEVSGVYEKIAFGV